MIRAQQAPTKGKHSVTREQELQFFGSTESVGLASCRSYCGAGTTIGGCPPPRN
jgi:hypothetical protein